MGLDLRAGVDLGAKLGEIDGRLDVIADLLTKPNIIVKTLPTAAAVVGGTTAPVLLDFGACPDGRIWDVDLINIFFKDPWTSLSGATPADSASGNVANAVATASLAGQAGLTNFVTGFEITGTGATAASIVLATLSGVDGGPFTYVVIVPAGVGTAITPLIVTFPTPIPATGANVAITLSVPAFGAGNTNSAAVLHGFRQAASGVFGALFVGQPPSPTNTSQFNPADNVALNLLVPGSTSYATRRPVVRNKQHVFVLVSGSGLSSLAGTFFATCMVSTVPDTLEALSWL